MKTTDQPPANLTRKANELVRLGAAIAGVPPQYAFSRRRSDRVSRLRFAVWFLLRGQGYTLADLGILFGRDHSAVIHGLRRTRNLLRKDPRFRIIVAILAFHLYPL